MKSRICRMCGDEDLPGDGKGMFMDSDVGEDDFNYPAIPVCEGCGGLGIEFDCEDFKIRCRRIADLRFEFHPTDGLDEPPAILLYQTLTDLINEVGELVMIYGTGVEDSYATEILSEGFSEVCDLLKEEADQTIDEISKMKPIKTHEGVEETRKAMLAMYRGNFYKGAMVYKDLLKKHPRNAYIRHDFAILILRFKRDKQEALRYFKESTFCFPKSALHFFQTARMLILLNREEEAMEYLKETKRQEDYEEFKEEHGRVVDDLLIQILGLDFSDRYN